MCCAIVKAKYVCSIGQCDAKNYLSQTQPTVINIRMLGQSVSCLLSSESTISQQDQENLC